MLGVLRERGLVVDQVHKTAPDSSPTEILPSDSEPKVPEPQPSLLPEQVIPQDEEPVSDSRSQQPEEDGHDSNSVNDPPLCEPVCERAQEKENEEPSLDLEPEPKQEPQPEKKDSSDEGEEVPLPDNESSDGPEKDQGPIVAHAGTHW